MSWIARGSGITNSAANTELMVSNGTNAIGGKIFSPANGNLTLGDIGLAGATRTITASGSATDVNITLVPQSNGVVKIGTTSFSQNGINSGAVDLNLFSSSGITSIYGGGINTIGLELRTFDASGTGTTTGGINIITGNGLGTNDNSGDINIGVGTKTGSGVEGSVNIQTRATGKIGVFNVTPVVKQSAATTIQQFYDGMVAYGWIPTSTISISRAIITSQVVGTDANITASPGVSYFTPASTLTANRTIDVTALNTDNDYIEIYYDNQSFTVSFTGQSVYFSDNVTTVGNLVIDAHYQIRRKNGRLYIIN